VEPFERFRVKKKLEHGEKSSRLANQFGVGNLSYVAKKEGGPEAKGHLGAKTEKRKKREIFLNG